jgi:inosine-uridine nucleoside N-ribohydrolase
VAAGAVLGGALAQATRSAAAGGSGPVPVIYDSDLDFDDASTLAYLCEEHRLRRIDLRAVTVANDGFGEPGRTLRHARSVLDQCGLPWVPVAEGATGAGVHPAPPELVTTIVARLAADQHAAGTRLAHRIVSQPDLAALIDLGIMYWWDAVAAVSAVRDDGGIATFRRTSIDVVLGGEQSGRTVTTPAGQPVCAASGADAATFEQRFLDSLNGRT